MYKFSEYNSSVLQVAGGKKDTIADSLSKRLLGNLSISHSPNLLLKKKKCHEALPTKRNKDRMYTVLGQGWTGQTHF